MQPISIPQYLSEFMPGFTGRAWVLPRILKWLQESQTRHFLITGDPGTGKSMVAAWVAGHGPLPQDPRARQRLKKLRGYVQGVHFCRFNTDSTSPAGLASNLARQLGNRILEFNQILLASLSEQIKFDPKQYIEHVEASGRVIGNYIEKLDLGNMEASEAFNRALRRPLIRLYETDYKAPMLLVVDALDEAYGASSLVQILAGLADLPVQVRWLITTRNDPRVLKEYPNVDGLDLERDCPPGNTDLPDFVTAQLKHGSERSAHPLSSERIDAIAGQVAQAAQGKFLYAYYAAQDLLKRMEKGPLPEEIHFPPGLSGHYHAFLNRELGKNEVLWSNEYGPVLGLLAVAQGEGLERNQLESLIHIDVGQILRTCAQYLRPAPPVGPLRLFHKSFGEFMLDEPTNHDYHIDAFRMHRKVIDYLYTGGNSLPDYAEWDEYGMRFAPQHLAGAAQDPNLNERLHQVTRMVTLVSDPGFRGEYETQVQNPSQTQSVLELALRRACQIPSPKALPLILKAAHALGAYRQSRQLPELVLAPAEAGEANQALRNLAVFRLEPYWRQAAELVIAWQVGARKKSDAEMILNRIRSEGIYNAAIYSLLHRVEVELAGEAPWIQPLQVQKPEEHVIVQILERMAGAKADDGLISEHVSGIAFNPEMLAGVESNIQPGGARFLANEDAPLLVAFAIDHTGESEPYLRRYLDLHAENKYLIYRDNSLWRLLISLLSHPNQDFTRRWLVEILRVVLDRRGLQFEESLQAARLALKASAGEAAALAQFIQMRQDALQKAAALQPVVRRNDQWGEHKRRLAALAEASLRLPEGAQRAAELLEKAFQVPRGFAGFMAPAWLNLAEAYQICGLEKARQVQDAIDQGLLSAQKIQEEVFCARSTARVNGLLRWWHGPAIADLSNLVERFAANPGLPEFCARHTLGETYLLRNQAELDVVYKPDGTPEASAVKMIPLSWQMTDAKSLRDLAAAIHLPLDDFVRANPGLDPDLKSPGVEIKVPDPEFTPLLAAYLAAQVLSHPDLPAKEKRRLAQLLVPPAASDPTALFTVLARMLLACEPITAELAGQVTA